jgi:hypothetical protein
MNKTEEKLKKIVASDVLTDEKIVATELLKRLTSSRNDSLEYKTAELEAIKYLNNPEDLIELNKILKQL